jgi:hypothetical protein
MSDYTKNQRETAHGNINSLTMPPEREEVLHKLLGTDFDFAVESGLIDLFYFDPEKEDDALLHILTGEVIYSDSDQTIVPGGFHHEPSSQNPQTYVDRSHLQQKNGKEARPYREIEFNPYLAHVVIGGLKKVGTKKDQETGERKLHTVDNGMFPIEYDALAVLQTIRLAYERIDPEKIRDNGRVLAVESKALLLDEKSFMSVRMLLDKDSGKIISAFPVNANRGKMRLSEEEQRFYLGLE